MRRGFLGLAVAGLALSMTADASACCHKKKAACEPAPVVCEPAPVVCVEPVKVKKHHKMKMPKLGCFKKKAECAPAPVVCETPVYTTVYAVATPQSYAAPQGMPAVPTK